MAPPDLHALALQYNDCAAQAHEPQITDRTVMFVMHEQTFPSVVLQLVSHDWRWRFDNTLMLDVVRCVRRPDG